MSGDKQEKKQQQVASSNFQLGAFAVSASKPKYKRRLRGFVCSGPSEPEGEQLLRPCSWRNMDSELFNLSIIDAADPVSCTPDASLSHSADTRYSFYAEETLSSRKSSEQEATSTKPDLFSFKRPRANLSWNVMYDLLGTTHSLSSLDHVPH